MYKIRFLIKLNILRILLKILKGKVVHVKRLWGKLQQAKYSKNGKSLIKNY
jgi:hypothetical protein